MKALLFGGRGGGSASSDAGLLILRAVTGLTLALAHGAGKVPPSAGFVEGVGKLGFPLPTLFAWSAGLSELAGGLLLAIGLLTRPAAFFIAVTMAVALFLRHAADPFPVQEKALIYLAIAVACVFTGSGRFGVDRLIRR